MRQKFALAQAYRLRRHFDELVVFDIGDGLFERQRHDRRELQRFVFCVRANVGELLCLQRIDVEIVVARMLAR